MTVGATTTDILVGKLNNLLVAPKDYNFVANSLVVGDIQSTLKTDSTVGTYNALIKTVKITENIGGNTVTHTVTLNKVITITVK